MSEEREPYNVLRSVGLAYGRAYQAAADRELEEMFDRMRDPDKYWRPRATNKGVGGKRRLLMKAGHIR